MTSELEELDALVRARRVGPIGCVEGAILAHPDMTGLIEGAVQHPSAPASLASEFLRKKGIDVGAQAIARHRRGACSCRTN